MPGRLKVGFWNVEKATRISPAEIEALPRICANRRSFAQSTIRRWFQSFQFDVLFLAEVVRGKTLEIEGERVTEGALFVDQTVHMLNIIGLGGQEFVGQFEANMTLGGRASSCNYAVIWNTRIPELRYAVFRTYQPPDQTRKTVYLDTENIVIGCIHAKSRFRTQARQEIRESCDNLISLQNNNQALALIGDMNIPFDSVSAFDRSQFTGRWTNVSPGMDITFTSHLEPLAERLESWEPMLRYYGPPACLDYIWCHEIDELGDAELAGVSDDDVDYIGELAAPEIAGGRIAARPLPPSLGGYGGWQFIDHAPIQYILSFKVR